MTETFTPQENHGHSTSDNVRGAICIFASAGLLFALFGSGELVSIAYDLPENDWTVPVVTLAEHWHAAMESLGTVGISQAIREFVADLRLISWP